LIIFTKTKKLDPNYQLTAQYQSSGTSGEMKEIKIQAPFMQWFTADGFFVAKPFQQWLASSIPFVGEADPSNAAEVSQGGNASEATVDTASVPMAVEGLATGSSKDGSSKRRKA